MHKDRILKHFYVQGLTKDFRSCCTLAYVHPFFGPCGRSADSVMSAKENVLTTRSAYEAGSDGSELCCL
jgi:hypothetical protein